ncbi:hypothetical protein LTR36_004863 [Oleoguttula mirabilis]|uniref:Uncharacterized protein n=1 Tax=Oleoguttula mirabilis TaxID=1507867 RepID=A0AAV9JET3_9PEZI|nr:hypothetical protein LTR36_004863 [Oleoguttula mirabilis]
MDYSDSSINRRNDSSKAPRGPLLPAPGFKILLPYASKVTVVYLPHGPLSDGYTVTGVYSLPHTVHGVYQTGFPEEYTSLWAGLAMNRAGSEMQCNVRAMLGKWQWRAGKYVELDSKEERRDAAQKLRNDKLRGLVDDKMVFREMKDVVKKGWSSLPT